ncbi:tannase and feruloyl esterase [Colletotrichum lupini]|uniref:Carboxylic ester hydrolase n=1 Tax=Colletotrichum lupini TaxID=145971 RepID=A0A9Q8WC66_9PEZI|nr:tannase and feruloyl esterase [Colletotrichum lupini]UQC77407.1 tannase and feruloyl esterase [Colletotrichum lupini]
MLEKTSFPQGRLKSAEIQFMAKPSHNLAELLQCLADFYVRVLDCENMCSLFLFNGPEGLMSYPFRPSAATIIANDRASNLFEASISYDGQVRGLACIYWYRYAISNDSNWDAMTLRPENYTIASEPRWQASLLDGLADGVLSSENSHRYYEYVSQIMGMNSEALDDFYRVFRISGMSHCGSGNGATFISHQSASTASLALEENVLMAMVRWIESEVAPDTIMGTRYKNGTSDSGVDFKHRHCRWPYHNVYQGVGDYKDPDTWNQRNESNNSPMSSFVLQHDYCLYVVTDKCQGEYSLAHRLRHSTKEASFPVCKAAQMGRKLIRHIVLATFLLHHSLNLVSNRRNFDFLVSYARRSTSDGTIPIKR